MTKITCSVLTISDTRTLIDDKSGNLLSQYIREAGHELHHRDIVKDDIYAIRSIVSQWIAAPEVNVVITTGGTGFTGRDSTPEALKPLFDKDIEGFGELFRQISFAEIGRAKPFSFDFLFHAHYNDFTHCTAQFPARII